MKLGFEASLLGLVLYLAVMGLPIFVSAHGDGLILTATSSTDRGQSYIVDVDYDSLEISAGSAGRFNFNLFKDSTRTKSIPFSKIFIRISKDTADYKSGETIYSGYIARSTFGGTGFSLWLPEAGAYTLKVRYMKDDDTDDNIAEAEFPFNVAPAYEQKRFTYGKDFWFGFALASLIFAAAGSLATYICIRKFNRYG